MPRTDKARSIRCERLLQYLEINPLATDDILAKEFGVSVNTIRLDRSRLGIKEFKERLKAKAEETMSKVTSISATEFVGDMINFVPGESAKSRLETNNAMTFEGMDVVRGEYIYSFAETIAISLIPRKAALVGVANIKYVESIEANTVIYALAEVKRKTESGYIVWVRIVDEKDNLKFKGKFILKGIK
ncbi:MAG: fatty acid biosynthesis transcriptional regulator [Clostridia bacterium]|nr:fatty acid biosynthesis transcriptional regulator [Clostridia bacterium]